jgi:hypothetical protein
MVDGTADAVDDCIRLWVLHVHPAPTLQQDSSASCVLASADIPRGISDHPAGRQIETQFLCCLQQHARRRFSAGMLEYEWLNGPFRMEGAVVPVHQEITVVCSSLYLAADGVVDRMDIVFREQATGDSALVRHDNQCVTGISETTQCIDRIVEEHDALGIAEVIVVADDGVVSIKENGTLQGQPPSPKQVRTARAASISG